MEPIIRFETQNEMERIQLKRRKEYWRNQENMDIYEQNKDNSKEKKNNATRQPRGTTQNT